MLKIIRAGMYTTVQDGGRHGFRQSGISHCGALDMPALRIANLLVGNDANAPALEITLGQLTVEFETDGWFALTGAGCEARLDDNAVWTGWRLPMKAGQRLTLKRPQHGMRSYLAVAGGIDVPPVMGSCSTDLKVGIGGLEGRLLRMVTDSRLAKRSVILWKRRELNSCCGATAFAPCRGRNIMSSIAPRRMHSGVLPGNLARKVTAWVIAYRGKF